MVDVDGLPQTKEALKELRSYNRKLFSCPPQKQAETQPTF